MPGWGSSARLRALLLAVTVPPLFRRPNLVRCVRACGAKVQPRPAPKSDVAKSTAGTEEGWSGAISGPTVIELRASNDRDEPADYNPAQNLLASVTLQTCFGPGQFPAAPGIPNLVSSTNLLSFPVSWTAVSGACEYVLQRQIGTGAWITRQTGIGTELAETVTGPGQYSYRVKACNSSANQTECSAYSPVASVNVATDQQVGFTQPCGLNVAACSLSRLLKFTHPFPRQRQVH